MPWLPIDILENVVDCSARYTHLLGSLSLTCRALTARTRVHLFHTILLGSPTIARPRKFSLRASAIMVTSCDTFLDLCTQNPALPLYVKELVITENEAPHMHRVWIQRSQSLVPLVQLLSNLEGFTFRTSIQRLDERLEEALSLAFSKPHLKRISLTGLSLGLRSVPFRIFQNTPPLSVVNLRGIYIDRVNGPFIPGPPREYTPRRVDTLAVSFDTQRVIEEQFIRKFLQTTRPLFDMPHVRRLRLQCYHDILEMDRVYAWLSLTPSIEELEIQIVPTVSDRVWRWQCQPRGPQPSFDCSRGLHIRRLRKASFFMHDHAGVGKIAVAMQFFALAERLTHVTIRFNSARGPVMSFDEEGWRQVDAAFACSPAFPVLESIEIVFGKNSYLDPGVKEKLRGMMPRVADVLRITLDV
ncbi:hypothetical protein C8J57DRAFT_1215212 [Mycena rebaudengoi]|nr:hypothetical protein C8J57DRAFT_1215212 [Mycena rebaudengoi]